MYRDHGDTIALQYGGSNLVNTIESYKGKQWSSHSRDMIEGIKRYYANSFSDADKQKAINLFLGVDEGDPVRVDLPRNGETYINWYTQDNIKQQTASLAFEQAASSVINRESDYWIE